MTAPARNAATNTTRADGRFRPQVSARAAAAMIGTTTVQRLSQEFLSSVTRQRCQTIYPVDAWHAGITIA
ncbi:hypothetical protein GCM10027605_38890 [Micromonospora zhanjiangensis]